MTHDADGLWLSMTDIARERGVSKQTVSAKVARLVRDGLLTPRPGGPGTPTLVNLAQYDVAVATTHDAIRAHAAPRARPALDPIAFENPDLILSKEQARRVSYQADIAKIDLARLNGQLIEVAAVTDAMAFAAAEIVRTIDQLPTRADDFAAAVAADGVQGVRMMLKTVARDLRERLAAAMRLPIGTLEPEPAPAPEPEPALFTPAPHAAF